MLIDGPRLRGNIQAMQATAASVGASLRPHFKTHRTLAIARLQREAGASGMTVATAAQLAAVGSALGPVLVSSPLQLDPAIAGALSRAHAEGEVLFSIESRASIERLRAALGPEAGPGVMIEVEAGCRRSGVAAGDCGDVARAAAALGFRVAGVFSYPGQSYNPGEAEQASTDEMTALAGAAAALLRAGFQPEHVSAGSTPTMRFARAGVATEFRPGTYVFGDRRQVGLGAMDRSQLALTVVATVVAVHGDRLVVDAGGKALGRDAPDWLPGFGELAERGQLITRLYDHHSVIEPYDGPPVAVGDRVAVVPNNANSAMSLLRSAWLCEDAGHADELRPQADR